MAPNGTDVLHVVRVQPRQRCAALLDAGDLPQVDPRAIGAWRAVELPLATKLARRAEELCLVLSLGVPDKGGPVHLPEALAHPAPVPDAGLGLCEQRGPPLGSALAAHALHCGARRAGMWCAPTETEERQRLSTLHGRGLHAQAHGILLAFRSVCIWNAAFCFFVFAFVLCGAVLGLALDCIGLFTSGCADRVSRLLLLDASDVDRHDACPLVQRSVAVGAFVAASVGSLSCCAHSWRSAAALRRSNASSKRARLHVTCLIILAGFGSCGAQSSGPPSAPRSPGTMVVSTFMTTTPSDMALHGRHLNEVSASTVGEFITAVCNIAVDNILLAAGTYELTSDMCTGSAVCINRALTIEAEVPGAVVLNAMGGRRIFEIQSGGTVELVGLNITGGNAAFGGGVSVDAGGKATLIKSNVYHNVATEGPNIHNSGLLSITPSHIRAGMQLAAGSTTTYVLPAPPGHWVPAARGEVWREACPANEMALGIRCMPASCSTDTTDNVNACSNSAFEGPCWRPATANQPCDWRTSPDLIDETVYVLPLGTHNLDFPFVCAPGILGGNGSSASEQTSATCAGLCPAGFTCGGGEEGVEPVACPEAHYCPEGSSVALPCPAGSYGAASGLQAEQECTVCPDGYTCPEGSFVRLIPESCDPGTYRNATP